MKSLGLPCSSARRDALLPLGRVGADAWPTDSEGSGRRVGLPTRAGAALCAVLLLIPGAGLHAQEPGAPGPEAAWGEPAPPSAHPDEVDPEEPAEPREYTEAIEAALEEHAQGRFEEARELLRRAHRILPSARTLRGLGKVEFELRNYADAARLFEEALSSPSRPLDARLRAEVEELLDRARTYVGTVAVELSPASALVLVDGVTVAQGPRSEVSLTVGEHLMEFRADGYVPEKRTVHVQGGEQVELRVSLAPPRAALAPSSAQASPQRGNVPLRRRWWVWTLTAAAMGGTATAFALAARDQDAAGPRVDGGSSGTVLVSP